VFFKVRNYGNTVAFLHRVALQTKWRPVQDQPEAPDPFKLESFGKVFIPPKSSWKPPDPTSLPIELPEVVASMLLDRIAYALVAGEIEFTDTFGITHVTRFGYALFFDVNGRSEFSPYTKPAFWEHEQRPKGAGQQGS
jgi:hypothetical protein